PGLSGRCAHDRRKTPADRPGQVYLLLLLQRVLPARRDARLRAADLPADARKTEKIRSEPRDNLINAGVSGKNSTFPNIQAAISQVLSNNEGSCLAIANEVGSAKILNPFQNGDIAYVESPYSYNSITDFQDNIRSIRNVWYGSTDGNAASISFNNFFSSVNPTLNTAVVNAFTNAINAIGNMPAPFVKYCSVIWNKDFDDPTNWDSTSGE
ncbi:MAG: hypothetical protein II011_08265, partial [Prevotella sp.]|nr:hypothetical protein [Prevotella sp.]